MSQTSAPVCAEGGSTSTKERKRAAQRDWWEREGKARRAAAREQEDARAVSQYDISEPMDEISGYTPNLQSRLGYAEEEHVRAIVHQMNNPQKEMSMTHVLLASAAAALGLRFKEQIALFLGQLQGTGAPSTGQQLSVPPAPPSVPVVPPSGESTESAT